jgi:itaconate CoA-transferase
MRLCAAAHPTIHPYGVFETADGAPLLISIQNEREFAQLCKIVLRDESIPEDPRFCSNVERVKHEAEFDEVMNAVFGSTPRAELCTRLDEAKVAYSSVNDCGGLSEHPALRRVSVSACFPRLLVARVLGDRSQY